MIYYNSDEWCNKTVAGRNWDNKPVKAIIQGRNKIKQYNSSSLLIWSDVHVVFIWAYLRGGIHGNGGGTTDERQWPRVSTILWK